MKKILLLIALMLIAATSAAAQQKPKSLTMDDVEPASPSASREASASRPEVSGDQERNWQDRMVEAEMKLLNAQLQAALNSDNGDAQLEVGRRQKDVAELAAQGTSGHYRKYRAPELIYRERYVKLRLDMIKEEKLHPGEKSTEDQVIYTKSKTGGRRTPGLRGQRTPLTERKVIKGKESKLDKLADKLEELAEEGRRAGLPTRIFED